MRFEKKQINKYIRLFPEKIPYNFQIDDFSFDIFVNTYSNDLYITGYDKNGQVLGNGAEKLVQDMALWWIYSHDERYNRDPRYPTFDLVPRSVDGKEYAITRENIGKWILSFE